MPLEKSRTPERDLGSTYLLNSMQIHEYIPPTAGYNIALFEFRNNGSLVYGPLL